MESQVLAHLGCALTALMFMIIFIEVLGAISNVICIYIVSRIKKSNLISRPKILMANIALSDTVLMIVTIIPRFVIIYSIIEQNLMAAHIIQSIKSYLENVSLYVEAITMVTVACDRYYSLKRVFNNPFDRLSTTVIIAIIWSTSLVLSVPFVVTTDIDYWNYTDLSVMCINTANETAIHNASHIQPFDTLMAKSALVITTRVLSMLLEFVIPTIVVVIFSYKIVIRLFDIYLTSRIGRISDAGVSGCEITKRLIGILFIFVMKNTAFILVTGRWKQIFEPGSPCPTSLTSEKMWFFFYEIYRITTTANSFIYFWLSTDFREQCRMFLSKCITSRHCRCSVREQANNIISY